MRNKKRVSDLIAKLRLDRRLFRELNSLDITIVFQKNRIHSFFLSAGQTGV
ncbi:MAG: hypothetical protein K5705_06805 [Oscillospiraceae bacterium]|nr:hypothetical protein [Oscillospiraceae bacterium]